MVQVDMSAGDSLAPGSAKRTGIKVLRLERSVILVAQRPQDDAVRLTQAWNEPEHLRIGGQATDAALAHFAHRLALPMAELVAFRAEVLHG